MGLMGGHLAPALPSPSIRFTDSGILRFLKGLESGSSLACQSMESGEACQVIFALWSPLCLIIQGICCVVCGGSVVKNLPAKQETQV